MNNRGSALDLIYVVVILFGLMISFFVFGILSDEYTDMVNDPLSGFNTSTANNITNAARVIDANFDLLWIPLVVFLIMGVVALVSYLNSNPVGFVISILVMMICILIAAELSNAYGEITSDGDFQEQADKHTIIPFYFNHQPLIISILGILVLVVLYARKNNVFGGGVGL